MATGPAVVLTREACDNGDLARALEKRSVPVVEIPCAQTHYCEPERWPAKASMLIFTSRRGVRGLMRLERGRRLLAGPGRLGEPAPLIGAVGTATARQLASFGFKADLVADPPDGMTLARELVSRCKRASRLVMVRGDLRASELDQLLLEAGFELVFMTVYRNVEPEIPRLERFPVSTVFVAAPSAAHRLLAANPWLRGCSFHAIGPTTAAALRDLGVARVTLLPRGDHEDALHRFHTEFIRQDGGN